MRLALATCDPLPEPDPDERLTVERLTAAGFQVSLLPWNRPTANIDLVDLILLKSTWDYPANVGAFQTWLQQAAAKSQLWNPLPVCLWNLDKHYLEDLGRAGVRTVPTVFSHDLQDIPWTRYVVKPTISCGSFMTRVFERHESAEASQFLRKLLRTHEPMVQPYLESVDTEGERSLIWIDGQFTHVVRKAPRFESGDEKVEMAGLPSNEEAQIAQRAIDAAPKPLLYARVDLMRDNDGELCVSELELLEPSLFFVQNPQALDRYVEGIQRLARVSPSFSGFSGP